MLARIAIAAVLVGLGSFRTAVADPASPDPYAEVRGITISCPGNGRIWGTDAMVETMAELREMGVNWIAIHPYASISADGTVGFQGGRRGSMYDDPSWLTRPIAEAHRLGLKILIKPHLAYWGSPFAWRGEIEFDTGAEWTRFFTTYQTWITHVARLTKDADAFAVGTELDATTHREADWRRVIAAVRAETEAPLTYAANWDRFERVPFWDGLDVIGIQAYFPLVAHEALPAPEELDAAWAAHLERLGGFAHRFGKKILFAELGYNQAAWAARMPWEYRQGGDHAEETQLRCFRAALAAMEASDLVVGAFLWKWFPGGERRRGDFRLQAPAVRDEIARSWSPRALPPAPASGS